MRPLAVACMVAACGGGDLVLPDNDNPLAMEVVGGDGQRGSVGEPLDAPVVVQVTDARGEPVEDVTIGFVLTSAGTGAGIAPATARTNAEGRAQAQVLLGDRVGVQTGEAQVTGTGVAGPKVAFSALAVAADNRSPQADFDWDCDQLTCRFTDASTDGDGSVTGWSWSFGDGGTSSEQEPTHTYESGGTYTVTLTVTDDGGATDESSDEVRASAPSAPPSNEAPRADFEIDCDDLRCRFTDRSRDEDGSIEGRSWDFGDGSTSTQRDPAHTYAEPGEYEVTLTVTDDEGAEDARTLTAEPETSPPPPPPPPPPQNDPPRAEFEVQCRELRCTFVDRSEDPDGSVVTWAWDFGDGATSSERNPSHTYAAPGRYEVLLLVTDDDGAADALTRTAEVEGPPPPEENKEPRADFEVDCDDRTCVFSDRSRDDDGTIVSWAWSFGDGSTSTEQNPVHTYAEEDEYEVLLTVTDDRGATGTRDREVKADD